MKKGTYILFIIILFELLLGGGGRLIAFGPLSLRMILFGMAMVCSMLFFFKGRTLPKKYLRFLLLFTLMLCLGLLSGIASGNNHSLWWEDIKPLLYFLILPFLAFIITSEQEVEFISRIVKISSIIIACCFIVVLILIHTSIIPFHDFYRHVINTQEFFFRGQFTFFYKGFLFLPIGFIFFYFTKSNNRIWILTFLFCAIILTLTRGLLLALTLTVATYHLSKSSFRKAVILTCLALVIVFAGQYAIGQGSNLISHFISKKNPDESSTVLLGDREYSDQGRWQQIKEVTSSITPLSLFIGHGFGQGVPSRPVHMEISYLEIFHKQGIIGLIGWGYLLWMLYVRWRIKTGSLKDAFFFSSLLIFFQSLTNQYINNPIGLSWLLISLVCLDQLNSYRKISVGDVVPHLTVT